MEDEYYLKAVEKEPQDVKQKYKKLFGFDLPEQA